VIVICDIETNGLINPDRLWLIVCKETESGKIHTFREPDRHPEAFLKFAQSVSVWVGHNFIGFDIRHLNRLVPGAALDVSTVVDTLVVSRLVNATRDQHSLESYGEEEGLEKLPFSDFSQLTEEMVTYCIRDVELNYRVYERFKPFINSDLWKSALRTEHDIAVVCNELHDNGFYFDIDKANELLTTVTAKTETLHRELIAAFPPRTKVIRTVTPRLTKHGTLHRGDFKFLLSQGITDLTPYSEGATFTLFEWVPFNPGSTVQIVSRLNEAGWRPTEKTKGHFLAEKEAERNPSPENDERLAAFRQTGWSISERNLSTLPATAPAAARTLATYLLWSNRRRLLVDWLEQVAPDHRIHGNFRHIGAWTHRMSHSEPNLANVPTEKPQDTDDIKELNNTLRSLFCVPRDRLLIGVDADSIQLRILAHYMDDPRFTEALIRGDSEKGTDLHSLNAKALGAPCKGRRDAKTFIYAWLLGAGVARVAEILGCSWEEAKQAREDFLNYYPRLQHLRQVVIPRDATAGYFKGLDGRFVVCYGNSEDQRNHYMLGGYLQNGESIVMKRANLLWRRRLRAEKVPFWQVNFVHDEWQTETVNDPATAEYIAKVQADSIRIVGEELNLKCPLAGSILNAHKKLAIGHDWRETH
jgi:DNA polymerase-1